MAEQGDGDTSQKTEQPTQRRLDDAREKGQIIHARDLSTWVVLLAATLVFAGAGTWFAREIGSVLRAFIAHPHDIVLGSNGFGAILPSLLGGIAGPMALLLGAVMVAAVAAGLAQTGGPLLTGEPLRPQASRVSPLAGMKRLFSLRSIAEFCKGLLKLAIVGVVATMVLMPVADLLNQTVAMDALVLLEHMRALALRLLIAVASATAVIALGDYLYQRFEHLRGLRMSKQDLRDEHKQTEGDPMIKARLRNLRQERSRRRMMAAVPKADVVITNPTHFAVALRYDMDRMQAPKLVAKGVDAVALRIQEVARQNGVPIVRDPPVARALHAAVDVDETIGAEHFKAVAEIIGYVFRLKGKLPPRAGARPRGPGRRDPEGGRAN